MIRDRAIRSISAWIADGSPAWPRKVAPSTWAMFVESVSQYKKAARMSAFAGTPLMSYLQLLGCDSVIVTGTTTSGCVRATVLGAFSLNFRVTVVEDGCFDRAQVNHAVNLCDMHAKYANVMHSDEVIDYRVQDFTRGGPYDLIIDLVARRSVFAYRRALAPGGTYLIVGGTMRALLRVVTVGALIGALTGRHLFLLAVKPGPEQFGQLAACCVDGSVRIHIDRVFGVDEVPEALAHVGEGRALGKVVVLIDPAADSS